MKYINEYRQRDLAEKLLEQIRQQATGSYHFMEVCGSHTHAIRRFGIHELIPPSIRLLSGPGCPVCVTGKGVVDRAVSIARTRDTILVTFGDMMRVKGTETSLQEVRTEGRDVRIAFSPADALAIAEANPRRQVVFLAIGFETTAPSTAITVKQAEVRGIGNIRFLVGHKTMPRVMKAVIEDGIRLNGYLCPGHVSTITGSGIYEPLSARYHTGTVISGFEPLDILQSLLMLIIQVNSGRYSTQIQYTRAVRPEGNPIALKYMYEVFEPADDLWRGFGMISGSGLRLRDKYTCYDAEALFGAVGQNTTGDAGCICGDILKGRSTPAECPLFTHTCTPDAPVGACMVSDEGTCHAYYKYRTHAHQD